MTLLPSSRFGPLPRPEVEKRLNHVVESEKWVLTPSHSASVLTSLRCAIRVNLTEDGRQALLKLSRGDMRRALNVMQVRTIIELYITREN